MSRMTLCIVTAVLLSLVSTGTMVARYSLLGDAVKVPGGPGVWKVQLLVRGQLSGDARLTTLTPLDFGRQHILQERCRSVELVDRPPDTRHPERRYVLWSSRAGNREGPFRATYEFHCSVGVRQPTAPMVTLERALYAPPRPGEAIAPETSAAEDGELVTTLARDLVQGLEMPVEQSEALFRHVDRVLENEPTLDEVSATPWECLRAGRGDAASKSRLLVAMLRSRGIAARLVTGLTLNKGPEQKAHTWVEAWVGNHWLPMCPFHHHFGKLPPTYLVFGFGNDVLVRSRLMKDVHHAFLVEKAGPVTLMEGTSPLQRAFLTLSLYRLPPAEQRLVEFLLLLPIAALVVCLYRNLVGLSSFGTFAPALLGLAFRDVRSMPGLLVFVAVVILGWGMRRLLQHYHLLQVPRSALLLSLVVVLLVSAVVGANFLDLPATKYVSIFPIVILTAMIERFWTLEAEDGTSSSFRTLLGTLLIAASVAGLLSLKAISHFFFRFPEAVGIVMAAQLLLGRYTGYRLSELLRFRDFARDAVPEPVVIGSRVGTSSRL